MEPVDNQFHDIGYTGSQIIGSVKLNFLSDTGPSTMCLCLHLLYVCVTLQSHYDSKLLKDNKFYIEHPLSVSALLS